MENWINVHLFGILACGLNYYSDLEDNNIRELRFSDIGKYRHLESLWVAHRFFVQIYTELLKREGVRCLANFTLFIPKLIFSKAWFIVH